MINFIEILDLFEKFIGKLDMEREYKYIEAGVSGLEKRSKKDLENSLNGTIFYWEIEKEANI